jgi:hypothetical protein
MKNYPARVALALLATFSSWALAQQASAGVIHRYSFNETGGTEVKDSIGTADGVLKGNGGFFDGSGHLWLPGGGLSNADPGTIAGYVDLPNHIISVLTNVSFEAWVSWQGVGAWQRIFDFGTSAGGEDVANGYGNYLFLTPQGNVNLRFAVRDPATGTEPVQLTASAPLVSQEPGYICVTVAYDCTANVSRLFSNAVLVASGPASVALNTINDVNNWLGRSQWADAMFEGSYDEFRIYDNALNPVEVAASYVSGPNQPSTDIGALGPVQAVHLKLPKTTMTEADKQQATSQADFANMSGVILAGIAGASYESDNLSVLKVSQTGEVTAVGPGVANLSVSYAGKTDSVAVTVNPRQQQLVVAGTLYVDLHARDASGGAGTWPNRTGKGDFVAEGSPAYVANVAGTGIAGVQFNGSTDAYAGPDADPDLTGSSDRSIEVWAYNPSVANEETLVAWGHRGSTRQNMSFNYGSNLGYGAVGQWADDVGWNGMPAAGEWHYLVYTYDGASTVKVYADGLLKNTRTLGGLLDTYSGFPIRLGAQGSVDGASFDFGQALSGYIALVRVHGRELSDNDIANNYLYGIESTAPGALQSVVLTLSPTTLVGANARAKAVLTANYESRSYLKVNGFATFESSDPKVAFYTNETVVAVNPGTAVITGTYKGKQASASVQVVGTIPATELKHRYSFSEPAGSTTVKDSVGTADGVIRGTGAAFDGRGQLSLPGGTSSAADAASIAGYVDLPNGIISSLLNATFEAWVTWNASGAWQRIFDFGTSDGGEDLSNGYGQYLFLSPQGNTNLRFAVRDQVIDAEPVQLTASAPLELGQEIYVAVTYNYTANATKLYSNAVVVASGPAVVSLSSIKDVNNWLGRSQWGDPMFQGNFNEFRIWEGALTDADVAAAFAAGPDTVPSLAKPPTMAIAQSGTTVVISWPVAATGFGLETTTSLGPQASWSAVTASPVVEDGLNKVSVPIEGTSKFYRLRK